MGSEVKTNHRTLPMLLEKRTVPSLLGVDIVDVKVTVCA